MISNGSNLTRRYVKETSSVHLKKETKAKSIKSINISTLLSFFYLVTGLCFYLYSFGNQFFNQPKCAEIQEIEEHGYLAKADENVTTLL